MPTNLSKAELATILSVLDGQTRNPANRDKALAALERRAAALGLTTDSILDAAPGLLDGRLSPADWLAQVTDADDAKVETAAAEPVAEATGWRKHTIRGAISGTLKKKLGLQVTSTKDGQGRRVYRLPA